MVKKIIYINAGKLLDQLRKRKSRKKLQPQASYIAKYEKNYQKDGKGINQGETHRKIQQARSRRRRRGRTSAATSWRQDSRGGAPGPSPPPARARAPLPRPPSPALSRPTAPCCCTVAWRVTGRRPPRAARWTVERVLLPRGAEGRRGSASE